jgi:hypothetical protein
MDARDKLIVEVGLTKNLDDPTVDSDLCHLNVSLSGNKFIAWTEHIKDFILLNQRSPTEKEFKTTIGCLGHLSLMVLGVHHFFS